MRVQMSGVNAHISADQRASALSWHFGIVRAMLK
jgi:hypothetical protein